MVLVLQRKRSDAHLTRISVGMELMKQRQQHIEQGDHRGQMGLNGGFQTMKNPLEATDDRGQRERGFHRHAIVPFALWAACAVLWHATFLPKAVVGQHDAASAERLDQLMELVIWRVHGLPIPVDHLAEAIENPAPLDTNAPTPVVFGFLAELLRAAPFPNGKQPFDRRAVDDQKKARIGQKALVPILVSHQQPLQSATIGQTCEQRLKISLEPARKGAEMAAFQGKQQADRHQFARVQVGLALLWNLFHSVIDKAKDLDENVLGGQKASSFQEWF